MLFAPYRRIVHTRKSTIEKEEFVWLPHSFHALCTFPMLPFQILFQCNFVLSCNKNNNKIVILYQLEFVAHAIN
jgi:hypothetical protein